MAYRLQLQKPRRSNQRALRLLLVAFLLMLSADRAAAADSSPSLTVGGAVPRPLALSTADIAALPHTTIAVTDDAGTKTSYEGVAVAEILRKAGAPTGKDLSGSNMTLCVVAGAPDGYRVVFALAELDPGFTDERILLADRRDGQPLNSREGPLLLVVPKDKRHARWVRGVTTLMIVNVR